MIQNRYMTRAYKLDGKSFKINFNMNSRRLRDHGHSENPFFKLRNVDKIS